MQFVRVMCLYKNRFVSVGDGASTSRIALNFTNTMCVESVKQNPPYRVIYKDVRPVEFKPTYFVVFVRTKTTLPCFCYRKNIWNPSHCSIDKKPCVPS